MTVTEEEFRTTHEEVGPKQEEMTTGIEDCINKFNNTDWGCWADLWSKDDQEKVRDTLVNLRDTWATFVTELVKLHSPGWPFWFLDSSDDWLEVKRLLTGQQAFLSDGAAIAFPATQSWNSEDARVYKAMPGAQNSAISGAGANAGALADHLETYGMQLIDLWFDMGMTFIDYVQLAAGTVARFLSADPTKWLDIVAEIMEAVNDIIDFVQQIMQLIKDHWAATKTAMFDLDADFADFSGSVAGEWPTPTNLAS